MAFDLATAKPAGQDSQTSATSFPKETDSSTGGFDLSTAKPIAETGGGAALVYPKQRATPSKPETREAIRAIGESVVGGGISGPIMPYAFMGAGAALSGFPATAPLGMGMMEMGGMMRAAGPIANVGMGMLSGLGEETVGQIAKSAKVSPVTEEVLRVAGGAITPEFGNLIKTGLVKFSGGAARDVTELTKALIKDIGVPEKELSPTQRQYIKEQTQKYLGGTPKETPEKSIYSSLEQGAEQIVDKYNTQASQLERQAQDLVDAAKTSAGAKTAAAQSKADRLSSQFENSAKQLIDTAQQRSQAILSNAQKQAEQIRSYAAKESPSVRQIQEIDAREALKKGQAEAQRVITDAQNQVNRLRTVAEKARTSGAGALERGKQALASVGEALRPSELIAKAREAIEPLISDLKLKRELNAEATKADAFNFALIKEQRGQTGDRVSDTNAFKSLMPQIDNVIENPTTKLTNVSVPEMKTQLLQVKRALDPRTEIDGVIVGKPVSYQGLENLRRFLRDRAMGLDVQGYDAIDKVQAGKLAEGVEKIMEEFSPSIRTYLDRYKADSEPLRVVQSKIGDALLGKEDFDFSRYSADAASVGKKVFSSEQGVKDFIDLLGKDATKAEPFARSFIADELRTANAETVAKKINDWRDWLPQFPKLQQDLLNAQTTMAQAERTGAKRSILSDLLRTKAFPLVPGAEKKAGEITTDAQKAAEEIRRKAAEQEQKFLSEQYKTATGIEEAAQAPAGKVMTEAQQQADASAKAVAKQKADMLAQAQAEGKAGITQAEKEARPIRQEAGQLSAQGEQIKNQILGKAFDVNRVQQVILSGDRTLWNEVGPIIAADPVAKQNLYAALKNTIAQTADTSPANLVRAWNLQIRPAMETTGLLTPKQLAETNVFMNSLERTVEGKNTLGFWKRALNNVLTAETGRGLGYITQPFNSMGTR